MFFSLMSTVLLFGGTFLLLSQVMLFSVQVVVESTLRQGEESGE